MLSAEIARACGLPQPDYLPGEEWKAQRRKRGKIPTTTTAAMPMPIANGIATIHPPCAASWARGMATGSDEAKQKVTF
jgi:hypothetical protein